MRKVHSILVAAFLFFASGVAGLLGAIGGTVPFHLAADEGGATADACYPRISFAIKLAETFGQIKQVSGFEISGNLMELYANQNSGTWTLVLVLPSGLTCEIGNGSGFKMEPQPQKV